MQFNWQVPPLGHHVEVRLGGGGREEVIVDGFSVTSGFSSELRSEHLLPIEGADVRVIITRNGAVPWVELQVDGVALAPEPAAPATPPVAFVPPPAAKPAPPPTPVVSLVVMAVAGLGGVLVSRLFGPLLFIPGLVGIGAYAILKRNVQGPGAHFIAAAALIWGHISWIGVGIFVVGNVSWLEWAILIGLGAAAALLLARPSWTVAVLLVAAQGYLLYANVETYRESGAGGSEMRAAIALHVILRLLSIVTLMVGTWLSRKDDDSPATSSQAYPSYAPPVSFAGPPESSRVTQAPSLSAPTAPPARPHGAFTPPAPSPAQATQRAAPVRTASRPVSQRWSVNPKLAAGIVVGLIAVAATYLGLRGPRASPTPVVVATGSTLKGAVLLGTRDEFHRVTVTVGNQPVELDERGHFVATDVPQGTHLVHASEPSTLEKEASAEVVVSGAPGEELQVPPLSLTPVAKVKGRLLSEDAFGGPDRPVEGGRLRVAATSLETRTDAQGRFELEVPPGPALFQALVEGHPTVEKRLELRWAPALLEFPRLPAVTNPRCAPTAARQGQGAQDLVGAGGPRPDGTADYVLRLVPCREGVIRRVQVLQRADTWLRWDTTAGLHQVLGLAAHRAPDTLLKAGTRLEVPVSRSEVLSLHLPQKPTHPADLELLLEYDDQSVDRVVLAPLVSVSDPY